MRQTAMTLDSFDAMAVVLFSLTILGMIYLLIFRRESPPE